MENRFISYDYIFDNFKEGDVFFTKELKAYFLLEKSKNGIIKELIVVDEDEVESSVYNYTMVSRILISTGIVKRIKQTIYWNKSILLTKECADELLDNQHEKIVTEYKSMLEDGKKNGLISEKEFKELTGRL